jgi:hypothetical protein
VISGYFSPGWQKKVIGSALDAETLMRKPPGGAPSEIADSSARAEGRLLPLYQRALATPAQLGDALVRNQVDAFSLSFRQTKT